MTVFNLDDSAGVWFDLEGGGRLQLRAMTAEILAGIRKQTVKRRVEYKRVEGRAERFEVDEVDRDLENALFWDHVIVAWEHLLDAKAVPIPCDRTHKLLLLAKSPRFLKFVSECLDRLQNDEAQHAEAAQKN